MKLKILISFLFFSLSCYGENMLNDRLPPIEFIFVNTGQYQEKLEHPLTPMGVQEAIEAARLLKDIKGGYIVCGSAIALKETAKFLAEQLSVEGALEFNSKAPPIGHYNAINISNELDPKAPESYITDKFIELIKNNYSHERSLILVSSQDIFNFLQKSLTKQKIDIKYGDVCIFRPSCSSKHWKIEYRPNPIQAKG